MAGNQLGKTLAGSMEEAVHATGLYPDWWEGRRFDIPTVAWCAGVTQLGARDTVQRLLLGRPGAFGTGAIPKERLLGVSMARGQADLVDTIRVRHISGGTSLLLLKSYEQGRQKWQGETLHRVWFDEEPPEAIYLEGLTRTNATGGMVSLTFTPLLGVSNVVRRFLFETDPGRHVTQMTIEEAEHYSPEERARIIATYPPHEREARTKGVPVLGSGRIFPVAEDQVAVEPFAIPKRWRLIGGLDFGWDHPFAAVKLAFDPDADIVYVTQAYRAKTATPVIHAASLRPWGPALPWAWPHDGLQHDKGSGAQLAEQYREQGLALLPERATFEDGTSGLEAGISEMLIRMETGRWKVFRHLAEWFEEFRLYHRKDGRVVKLADDLLSASRYAMMMLRFAEPESGLWNAPLAYDSRGIV
jgi:phage terminase large subunit-like protein